MDSLNLLFRTFLICTSLLLGAQSASACTCVADSLGKRFRNAKAVFIGRASNEERIDESLLQNRTGRNEHSQVLEVIKSFKGAKRGLIGVTFESVGDVGMCPTLYHFEPSREYLVFAYGSNYQVRTVCSDTWVIPHDKEAPTYDLMQRYVKRLGSSWFRFQAELHLS